MAHRNRSAEDIKLDDSQSSADYFKSVANLADRLAKKKVAVMVGDWTNGDPAISRFLAAHGRSGVPFYLWYPAGGGEPKELPQVLTGDQAPPADLDVGQVAAAHLVVEQVAGQAGQAGSLTDGVGQPPAVRVLAGRAGGCGGVVAGRH